MTGTDPSGCVNTATTQVKVVGCAFLGELNSHASHLRVYPNPNGGNFIIESDRDCELELCDDQGRIVRRISLSSKNNHTIKVEELASGIYFLRDHVFNETLIYKIAVEK